MGGWGAGRRGGTEEGGGGAGVDRESAGAAGAPQAGHRGDHHRGGPPRETGAGTPRAGQAEIGPVGSRPSPGERHRPPQAPAVPGPRPRGDPGHRRLHRAHRRSLGQVGDAARPHARGGRAKRGDLPGPVQPHPGSRADAGGVQQPVAPSHDLLRRHPAGQPGHRPPAAGTRRFRQAVPGAPAHPAPRAPLPPVPGLRRARGDRPEVQQPHGARAAAGAGAGAPGRGPHPAASGARRGAEDEQEPRERHRDHGAPRRHVRQGDVHPRRPDDPLLRVLHPRAPGGGPRPGGGARRGARPPAGREEAARPRDHRPLPRGGGGAGRRGGVRAGLRVARAPAGDPGGHHQPGAPQGRPEGRGGVPPRGGRPRAVGERGAAPHHPGRREPGRRPGPRRVRGRPRPRRPPHPGGTPAVRPRAPGSVTARLLTPAGPPRRPAPAEAGAEERAPWRADLPGSWYRWSLALATLGGAVLRASHMARPFNRLMAWNEGHYAMIALNFDRYGLFSQHNELGIDHTFSPGVPWLIWLAFKAFGPSEWAARLPIVVAGVVAIPLLGVLVRRLFGSEWLGAASAAFVAVSPGLVYYAQNVQLDTPSIACGLAGAVLLLRYRDTQRPGHLWGAGLWVALAVWFKFTAALWYPVFLLWGWSARPPGPAALVRSAAFVGLTALPSAAWVVSGWLAHEVSRDFYHRMWDLRGLGKALAEIPLEVEAHLFLPIFLLVLLGLPLALRARETRRDLAVWCAPWIVPYLLAPWDSLVNRYY